MSPRKSPASPAPAQDPRPLPPRRPGNDECCGSGCIPCIFDIYEDQMERYQEQLAAWEKRHAGDKKPSRGTSRPANGRKG